MSVIDQIKSYFKKKWKEHQVQKKLNETYRHIDSNKAGRFSQKEYLKEVDRQKKMQMKKNREYTEEKKAVEKKK